MSRISIQIATVIVIAITLFVLWDFSQRITTNARIAQTEKQAEIQVAQAQATHTALVERKKIVQSDVFVEDQMRRQHWAREGEMVMVPLITPAAPMPAVVAKPTPVPDKPWWQDWYDLLFGP